MPCRRGLSALPAHLQRCPIARLFQSPVNAILMHLQPPLERLSHHFAKITRLDNLRKPLKGDFDGRPRTLDVEGGLSVHQSVEKEVAA
jgi:hypothetical protein